MPLSVRPRPTDLAARPHCEMCGRPFKLDTDRISQPVDAAPPKRGDVVTIRGRQRAVLAASRTRKDPESFLQAARKQETMVWCGDYSRKYGDEFCTQRCALRFACAAYAAGYRITKK